MSAEEVAQAGASAVSPDSDNEDVPGYKPPADKSIDDIINADQEDDSLNRYKASLGLESGAIVVFPDDPRQVIVQKLALVSEGQPDREIDLTQDLEEIKKKVNKIVKLCLHLSIKFGSPFVLTIIFRLKFKISR